MPDARALACDLLLRLDRTGGRVRELLGPARSGLADPRERALLTELAYGCVRRRGTLDAVLGSASRRPIARLHGAVRTALRVALYQALFLDRIPDHAAVNGAVMWAGARAGTRRAAYVNGVVRALLRDREGPATGPEDPRRDVPREDGSAVRFRRPLFSDPAKDWTANGAARFSMPVWLVARWLERWGEPRCGAILRAGITRPPLTLRARCEPTALVATLRARGIPFEAGPVAGALLLPPGEHGALTIVAAGDAAVQDAASQRVAPLLEPRAGQRILDLCAAPGGKALQIADLMGAGEVVACDVDAGKVSALDALAPRVPGVAWRTAVVPAKGPLPFEPGSFDAILVDAPCSNTGVLRRRVEARWRLQLADIGALARLQGALLERSLPLLAPSGRLVYSTCSLESEENEEVLERFLGRHPHLAGEEAFRAWPGREQDGGYAAVITRRA